MSINRWRKIWAFSLKMKRFQKELLPSKLKVPIADLFYGNLELFVGVSS